MLAQSIGGGGGLVIGVDGRADKNGADDLFGAGPFNGDANTVTVTTGNGARIATSGDGAAGILAQSIGGGGAIIGGLDHVDLTKPVQITTAATPDNKASLHNGSGGDINITVGEHTTVTTTGARAYGIFAQANGAGGGVYSHADGSGFTIAGHPPLACGGVQQIACTGHIAINVTGFVETTGAGAYAIYAQDYGNGIEAPNRHDTGVHITLSEGEGIVAAAAPGTAAIYIDAPRTNSRIDNSGYIGGASGVAIGGTGSADINNWVWIRGDIVTSGAGAGYNITNYPTGRIYTGKQIMSKGTLINQGELWLGNAATNFTTITSDLNSTGRLIIGVDFAKGAADAALVQGNANISGAIFITPINPQPATVTFLVAYSLTLGPITASNFSYNYNDDTLTPVTPLLYSYVVAPGQLLPNSLTVTLKGQLSPPNLSLGANQGQLADHLQSLFDTVASGSAAILSPILQNITTPAQYQDALESLGPDALGSMALLQPQADRSFAGAMMSCPSDAGRQELPAERNCVWLRGVHGDIDRGSTTSSLGYDARYSGFQIGGQRHIAGDWLIGGSLAYQTSDIGADRGRGQLNGEGVDAGVFVKRQSGPLLLAAAVTGGYVWYDTRRFTTIGGPLAIEKASPTIGHVGLHGRIAYQFGNGDLYAKPLLDLDAAYVHVRQFTETGSPFALRVAGRGQTSFSATPAIELGGRWQLGSFALRPYVRAGATFNTGNDWHFDAGFASVADPSLTFRSRTTLPNTAARVGAGLDLIGSHGFALRLQYDAELSSHYTAQQGSVRLSYQF